MLSRLLKPLALIMAAVVITLAFASKYELAGFSVDDRMWLAGMAVLFLGAVIADWRRGHHWWNPSWRRSRKRS